MRNLDNKTTDSPRIVGFRDFFISYSREDEKVASEIQSSLSEAGYTTWIDKTGIPPAADWLRSIKQAVAQSHNFIFLLSPNSLQSRVCMLEELAEAISARKKIIPITISEFDPQKDVPKNHLKIFSELRKIHFVHLRPGEDDFENGLKEILKALNSDYSYIERHTELHTAADIWDSSGKPKSRLLRGNTLERAEAWVYERRSKYPRANDIQIKFVSASREEFTKFRLRIIYGLSVALIIIAIAASIAALQARSARIERDFAFREKMRAEMNEGKAWIAQAEVAAENRNFFLASLRCGMPSGLSVFRDSLYNPDHENLSSLFPKFSPERSKSEASCLSHLSKSFIPILVDTEGNDKISTATLSPSSKYYGIVSEKELRIKSTGTGTLVGKKLGVGEDIQFLNDSTILFVDQPSSTLFRWDFVTNNLEPLREADSFLLDEEKRIIALAVNGELSLFAFPNFTSQSSVGHFPNGISDLSFDGGSTRLAISSGDSTNVWSIGRRRLLPTLEGGHAHSVGAIDFSTRGHQLLYTGARDQRLVGWDASSGEIVGQRKIEGHGVFCLDFNPDGSLLATGGSDGRILIWDLDNFDFDEIDGHRGSLTSVEFSACGRYLISSDYTGSVIIWECPSPKWGGHIDRIGVSIPIQGKFLNNNKFYYKDKSLRSWILDVNLLQRTPASSSHENEIAKITTGASVTNTGKFPASENSLLQFLSSDGSLKVTVQHDSISVDDTKIKFGDLGIGSEGSEGRKIEAHLAAFDPEKKMVAIWLDDWLCTLALSPKPELITTAPYDEIPEIAIFRNGFIFAGHGSSIRTYSGQTLILKTVLNGHEDSSFPTVSPFGKPEIWSYGGISAMNGIDFGGKIIDIDISENNVLAGIGTDGQILFWYLPYHVGRTARAGLAIENGLKVKLDEGILLGKDNGFYSGFQIHQDDYSHQAYPFNGNTQLIDLLTFSAAGNPEEMISYFSALPETEKVRVRSFVENDLLKKWALFVESRSKIFQTRSAVCFRALTRLRDSESSPFNSIVSEMGASALVDLVSDRIIDWVYFEELAAGISCEEFQERLRKRVKEIPGGLYETERERFISGN